MSTPLPHYHGIDVANLNALVTDIRERLSGGLTGDFYEKGGVIKEGARHAQLPLLFNAIAKIESLVSALENQAAVSDAADADNTKAAQKGGGKPNKSMIATIKELVHAEVEMRTRTVSIETERLKTTLQKLESHNATLIDEVASLKIKVKKGGIQPATPASDEKCSALDKRVGAIEELLDRHHAVSQGFSNRPDITQHQRHESTSHSDSQPPDRRPTVAEAVQATLTRMNNKALPTAPMDEGLKTLKTSTAQLRSASTAQEYNWMVPAEVDHAKYEKYGSFGSFSPSRRDLWS